MRHCPAFGQGVRKHERKARPLTIYNGAVQKKGCWMTGELAARTKEIIKKKALANRPGFLFLISIASEWWDIAHLSAREHTLWHTRMIGMRRLFGLYTVLHPIDGAVQPAIVARAIAPE